MFANYPIYRCVLISAHWFSYIWRNAESNKNSFGFWLGHNFILSYLQWYSEGTAQEWDCCWTSDSFARLMSLRSTYFINFYHHLLYCIRKERPQTQARTYKIVEFLTENNKQRSNKQIRLNLFQVMLIFNKLGSNTHHSFLLNPELKDPATGPVEVAALQKWVWQSQPSSLLMVISETTRQFGTINSARSMTRGAVD